MRLCEVIFILDEKKFNLKPETRLKEVTSILHQSPGTVGWGVWGVMIVSALEHKITQGPTKTISRAAAALKCFGGANQRRFKENRWRWRNVGGTRCAGTLLLCSPKTV